MFNLSICTISFRHQLISLPEIAIWASQKGFNGIELWGVHARAMQEQFYLDASWLRDYKLDVPMISDYLSVDGNIAEATDYCQRLCKLAGHWGATKVRTFAGGKSSAIVKDTEFSRLCKRIRTYCEICEDFGIDLLIETHPNTYGDNTASTLKLLSEVDHPSLKVNFDVLHLWEAGDDPIESWSVLARHIRHIHIKNISSRNYLDVFQPGNIYSPAGSREGIVPVFNGCFDYQNFFDALPKESVHHASLEWFGGNIKAVLERDLADFREVTDSIFDKAFSSIFIQET